MSAETPPSSPPVQGSGWTLPRRWIRRALDSAVVRVLAAFGSFYIWLIYQTQSWRWIGREHLDAMFAEPSFVAAVWHGRLAPIAMLRPRGRRAVALISANRDGALLGRIMANTGAEAVYGSSRDPKKRDKAKGGAEASAQALKALEDGAILVITPDGPRGPRMRAKPGVAVLSATAQVPVLPVAYAVRNAKEFKTWDRFLAPWPFSRGVFVFGEPIPPAPAGDEAAIEARRLLIEEAVIAATRQADAAVGRDTPAPGPPFDASQAAL